MPKYPDELMRKVLEAYRAHPKEQKILTDCFNRERTGVADSEIIYFLVKFSDAFRITDEDIVRYFDSGDIETLFEAAKMNLRRKEVLANFNAYVAEQTFVPALAMAAAATPPEHEFVDAPACPYCGARMERIESCFRCYNCGATVGCS